MFWNLRKTHFWLLTTTKNTIYLYLNRRINHNSRTKEADEMFRMRGIALLGVALIILSLCVIALLAYFRPVETINHQSVDLTTQQSYYSDKFRAERGDWFDLDITSEGASVVHVSGQVVGEIFKVEGTTYKYTVSISQGDVYQVQVENKKGHSEWFGFSWVPEDNHITGNLYLKGIAAYVEPMDIAAVILSAIGIVLVASSVMLFMQQRKKTERSRVCPQCRQTVAKDKAVCPYCGFDVTKSVRCKHCDTIYDSTLYKCPNCGAKKG